MNETWIQLATDVLKPVALAAFAIVARAVWAWFKQLRLAGHWELFRKAVQTAVENAYETEVKALKKRQGAWTAERGREVKEQTMRDARAMAPKSAAALERSGARMDVVLPAMVEASKLALDATVFHTAAARALSLRAPPGDAPSEPIPPAPRTPTIPIETTAEPDTAPETPHAKRGVVGPSETGWRTGGT